MTDTYIEVPLAQAIPDVSASDPDSGKPKVFDSEMKVQFFASNVQLAQDGEWELGLDPITYAWEQV